MSQGGRIVAGVGCGAVILICCSTLALAAAMSNNNAPQAAAKATATATTDPTRALNAYKAMVIKDSGTVSADDDGITTSCSGTDFSACSAAFATFDTDVQAFQQDLKDTPAPACLKAADMNLQKALGLYDSGAQTAMTGIDQLDASLIQQGGKTIEQGNTYLALASASIKKAVC
jgi:hypothetical protein